MGDFVKIAAIAAVALVTCAALVTQCARDVPPCGRYDVRICVPERSACAQGLGRRPPPEVQP